MINRALVPVFITTLLLSASLLFAVQPMFGRMVLPLLGGAPAVWNTLMVFFQAALLAGYAYAHLTSRLLSVRQQGILHLVLLLLCLCVLPVMIPAGWVPPESENPSLWVLALAAVAVGGPFFILSGSAPMFQRWFAASAHKDADNPYFLYAASNLGSMAALLGYPFVIEPLFGLAEQSLIWRDGFTGLIIMALACLILVWRRGHDAPSQTKHDSQWKKSLPSWPQRGLWVVLAFIPSSLMLGVTLHVTTDIASVPLLWVIPLALYLLTFVIVFARRPWIGHQTTLMLHAGVVPLYFIVALFFKKLAFVFVAGHFLVFFITALMCHWELSKSKPSATHLTEFYLWMSFGGVLGGIFNALVAPVTFDGVIEYYLMLVLACLFRHAASWLEIKNIKKYIYDRYSAVMESPLLFGSLILIVMSAAFYPFLAGQTVVGLVYAVLISVFIFLYHHRNLAVMAGVGALVGLMMFFSSHEMLKSRINDGSLTLLHQERNFFGVMKVLQSDHYRFFVHGTTLHGLQSRVPEERTTPLGYYHPASAVGEVFKILDAKGAAQQMVDIGLGAGMLNCYAHKNRRMTFFEIDPAVKRVAMTPSFFTYMTDCAPQTEVLIGDGRLGLAALPPASYDLVFVDAFTSDNIPVHLMTREAVTLYLSKLKPDGLLVLHISNNYLDLEKVLGNIAEDLAVYSLTKLSIGATADQKDHLQHAPSLIAVLAKTPETLAAFDRFDHWQPTATDPKARVWTDDFSNIFDVLIFKPRHLERHHYGARLKALTSSG